MTIGPWPDPTADVRIRISPIECLFWMRNVPHRRLSWRLVTDALHAVELSDFAACARESNNLPPQSLLAEIDTSETDNMLSVAVSSAKISAAEDRAIDRSVPKGSSGMAGIVVSSGPVNDTMDIDGLTANGFNKRKSRASISKVSYRDDDSESDAEPLVSSVSKYAGF